MSRDDGSTVASERLSSIEALTSSQQSSNAYDDSVKPQPVCSVLNVVVNYVMQPPTALEPREYMQMIQNKANYSEEHNEQSIDKPLSIADPANTKTSVRVPVLRIFGPIVRRDTSSENTKPVQSACVYIHGAYPYLLARPRIAGPDGSLHPFRSTERLYIDWDDVEAVRRIVPVLTTALERAIVASSSFKVQEEKSASTDNAAVDAISVVRKITVVKGRGFYSYCPGPAAPFLRIEYYDPSERWKVKRALEQGLDVETLYYPDPRQYTTATGQGPVVDDDSALLRFHCYEAHIPYTMQFFKDYNLAGLSYIHLQNPRFRHVPRQRRQTYALYKEEAVDNQAMFLESNAVQYFWPAAPFSESQSTCLTPIPQQTFSSSANSLDKTAATPNNSKSEGMDEEEDGSNLWHPPPTRGTICDVELDVHVRDILNVLDIMTEQPEDGVHWRAVPSLRELWAEERRRMEQLLPKTTENISFTLSVKSPKTAQPGTALAVKGMKKLLDSSETFLASDFERCALQIRDRHASAIENVDEAWKQCFEKASEPVLAETKIASPMDEVLTPNFDQTIDALNNLDRVGEGESKESGNVGLYDSPPSHTQDNPRGYSLTSSQKNLSQNERFENATQSYYDNQHARMSGTAHELSQRMDRGEAIVDGPFYHLDDFIDPSTLRPFDLLEDEDSLEDGSIEDCDSDARYKRVETEMQRLATQTFLDKQNVNSDHPGNRSSVLTRGQPGPGGDLVPINEPEPMFELSDSYDNELDEDGMDTSTQVIARTPANTIAPSSNEQASRKRPISGVDLEDESSPKLDASSRNKRAVRLGCEPDSQKIEQKTNSRRRIVDEHETSPYLSAETYSTENQKSSEGNHNKMETPQPTMDSKGAMQHSAVFGDAIDSPVALQGIGNQGGRLWVEGGGTLKAKTHHSQIDGRNALHQTASDKRRALACPITIMSIETHVQCRSGRAGYNDAKQIAMVPNSERDKVAAVVYVFARDPGGGEMLQILERGCIFTPVQRELAGTEASQISATVRRLAETVKNAMPKRSMGAEAPISVDCVEDERKLLLRLSSKVMSKDPDMLLSWDPQGSGIGYLIERGLFAAPQQNADKNGKKLEIDMARLLGRMRTLNKEATEKASNEPKDVWKGSGLGKDWDERVGPGVAAASIEGRLVFSTWKLVAEEVKHPNASYLQAVVSSVLNKRIPFHDNLRLTQWYGNDFGRERWRVLHHKLTEATAGLLLVDALDMIGRAGEAARLSGVEFSQSFPGIRGSQYKVEGVLLRALKSLNSSERGNKRGIAAQSTSSSAQTHLTAESKSQTQVCTLLCARCPK
jgi:hypothetical protein